MILCLARCHPVLVPLPCFTQPFQRIFTTLCPGFASLWCQSQLSCQTALQERGRARSSPAPKVWCCLKCRSRSSPEATPPLQTRTQDRGGSEGWTVLGHDNLPVPAVNFGDGRDLQPQQEAAPGDAEVKRGEKKGCTIKERQRGTSASSCYQEVTPKGRVWNGFGGRNGENPAGSVSPWSQRGAGRQNSTKGAAVGAQES